MYRIELDICKCYQVEELRRMSLALLDEKEKEGTANPEIVRMVRDALQTAAQ